MFAPVLRCFQKGGSSAGLFALCLFYGLLCSASGRARAQVTTFAGNAQHTSNYNTPAQNLNTIKWTTTIDFNNDGRPVHYGSPLMTASNTVLAPVKLAGDHFRVDAFNGTTGAVKYSVSTDYILPFHRWMPTYNPCIATGAFGTRMYYPGAGGTIWHIDNPDSNTPGTPVRDVFYTTLANYNANASNYNTRVFVNTPLTADSQGNIYFGFRVQGTAPAPLNTTQSGFARIDPNGQGTYVLAGAAANDALITQDCHNSAPALSNDESTLYVVVKWVNDSYYGYLLGLNPTTLTTKYKVLLRDPRNNNTAGILDDGTASPTVAPDGDVYLGVFANPGNGSRGFLLRFSGDLATTKTPGGFGWDYTTGIVPASMVPSYKGTSPYLIFSKYNNYYFFDGNGINRVAILDPNATQIDPHPSAAGLVQMREVLTVTGPTPDRDYPAVPLAVREWCINAPAVNPATQSIFFDNEDGRIYRWNLATNSLDQSVVLTPGIGAPYIPTVIGPDGTIYTLNGGTLFAIGNPPGQKGFILSSTASDLRETVPGTPIIFTASILGKSPTRYGTVTFTDRTFNGLTPVMTTLAANVPVNNTGRASIKIPSLAAGGTNFGTHFITATYHPTGNQPDISVTMVQKVHPYASRTTLASSPQNSSGGQSVTFTATVASVTAGAGTPTGMVTFQRGNIILGQIPLNASGVASLAVANLPAGTQTITAVYASDTVFAASTGSIVHTVTP